MKKLFYLPLFFGVILLASGCELLQQEAFDLVDPNPVTLPDPAANFIQANYPEHQLRHLDNEDLCDNTRVIKVELEDGLQADVDLYFTPSGTYLFSATALPVEALPPAVLEVINSSYADYTIDAGKVERYDFPDGNLQYKVELVDNNGEDHDLLLAEDGTLICWEKDYPDDDNDDDNGSGSTSDSTNVILPDSIRSFISSQYPGYQIDHAEREDLCDDIYYLKVELEDGPGPDIDLYFDLNWSYSFAAIDIAESDIPTTVSSSLTTDFPGYSVVSRKTQRLEFPNGNIEYYLRLSAPAARDQKVIYDASGNLKCVDQRNDNDDDNDDDDDDDDDNDDDNDDGDSFTLPDSIRTFIRTNYEGYHLGQPEREDRCNDQYFIKIELEDGPGRDVDLYFSLDWVFSFSATEVAVSELPVAVTAALENDFPGARFDDLPEQLHFPDDTIQYYLEVETAEDNYDLLYAEDGILLCNDRS